MVAIFSPSRVTNHPNRWGNLSCFNESHVSRNATFLSECNGTRLGSYLDVGYALSRGDLPGPSPSLNCCKIRHKIISINNN